MRPAFAAAFLRPKFEQLRLGSALAISLLATGLSQAHAQTPDRWYVAGAVTGSDLNKPHQTIANAPTPGSMLHVTNDVDFGWGGQLAVGHSFGPVRLEGEIGRTENKSKSYSATAPIQITLPQDGHNNITRFMANGYYDFPQGELPVRLFVGAGLGAARGHVSTFAAPARAPNAPPSQLMDFGKTVFAYQLMGGLSRDLTPNLALIAQYRWFDARTIKGEDARGERATRKLAGSNVDVGLRYAF